MNDEQKSAVELLWRLYERSDRGLQMETSCSGEEDASWQNKRVSIWTMLKDLGLIPKDTPITIIAFKGEVAHFPGEWDDSVGTDEWATGCEGSDA